MQHVPTVKTPGETSSLVSLNRPYVSIKDCVVRSYKTEGVGVFFRGLGPTLLRGFPVNAVTFYVYEVVMKLLGA
jgi:solute carrier family 25 carnitine/acylcarnitine transporter 20/29